MRRDPVLRFLFIVYCIEVGVFLLLTPWSASWDRGVVQIPWVAARALCLHPLARGVLSGFGLVHLVWGAHDLDLWLLERRLGGTAG